MKLDCRNKPKKYIRYMISINGFQGHELGEYRNSAKCWQIVRSLVAAGYEIDVMRRRISKGRKVWDAWYVTKDKSIKIYSNYR
jgi:hypothetical protein